MTIRAHAGLKAAAVTLVKIANDLRWLGSGAPHRIDELILPGKVMRTSAPPTQSAS